MNPNVASTIIEFEMTDGTKVNMSLNFYLLYQLKNKNEATYGEYTKIMSAGTKDEIEMIVVLYTAYLCANLESECMSFEDFLMNCPVNRSTIRATVNRLISPKKQ